jgi:hypothetical protein
MENIDRKLHLGNPWTLNVAKNSTEFNEILIRLKMENLHLNIVDVC